MGMLMKTKIYLGLIMTNLLLNSCSVKIYDIYYDPTIDEQKSSKIIENLNIVTRKDDKYNYSFKVTANFKENLPLYKETILKKTVKAKYTLGKDILLTIISPIFIAFSPLIIPLALKNDKCGQKYVESFINLNNDHKLIYSSNTLRYKYKCLSWGVFYWGLLPLTAAPLAFENPEKENLVKIKEVPLNLKFPTANTNRERVLSASGIPVSVLSNNKIIKRGDCSSDLSINMEELALNANASGQTEISISIEVGSPDFKIIGDKTFNYKYQTAQFLPPQKSLTERINVLPVDAILSIRNIDNESLRIVKAPFVEKSETSFNPQLSAKYIKVEKTGYKTEERYLASSNQDRTTDISLQEIKTGYLKLTSSEDNVEILLDGKSFGFLSRNEPFNKKIEAGSHQITAKKEFFRTNTIKADIEYQQVFSHNFKLIQATSDWKEDASKSNVIQAVGNLTVVTERKDLIIYIDGVKKIPSVELKNIAAGRYDMKVVGNGVDKTLHIIIEDGKSTYIDLDIELQK
jgi:hypothetical protein